jgi:hypothetical protein
MGIKNIQAEMEQRWVDLYKSRLKGDGNKYWQEWHENHTELQGEIDNLFEVIQFCQDYGRYEDLKEIWRYLSDYAHIYGYWNHSLSWLEWLETEAKIRGDWQVFVSVVSKRSWTKILMGSESSLRDAEILLREALKHCRCDAEKSTCNYSDLVEISPDVQYDAVENFSALLIRQGKYEEARVQLLKAKSLIELSGFSYEDKGRRSITVTYYEAEIAFREGNISDALSLFNKVKIEAGKIKWYRAVNYAYNWLADIAILQHQFDDARFIIESNQKVAEEQNDMRRIACFRSSDARLANAESQTKKAISKAQNAMETFEHLGMAPEIFEMQSLIKKLSENADELAPVSFS